MKATMDINGNSMPTHVIGRRAFAKLIVGTCAWCALGAQWSLAQSRARGCRSTLSHFPALPAPVGQEYVDMTRLIRLELEQIRAVMGINPTFRIISNDHNAFATPDSRSTSTRGTVIFGYPLLISEIVQKHGSYAIAGIAAHEGAHIHQFFSGDYDVIDSGQSTAKRVELHADFLAGYYLGTQKASEKQVESFARSLSSMGDVDFNNPDHHGTSDERVRAMHYGRRACVVLKRSFTNAAKLGITYVRNNA